MKLRSTLWIVLVPLLLGNADATERFPEWLEPCPDAGAGALCGTYPVWEDRTAQTGNRIELYVVVLPATGPGPYEAPIFPLAGGPGQAASDGSRIAAAMYAPLRSTRDIVLLDQRGTGSSGKLDCGAPGANTPLQILFEDFPSEEFARECLKRQTADVTLYTTDQAVGDLDEVRQALGYDQINLDGGSYGTRVALHYLRRHSKHVRAAALNGVAPPHSPYQLQFAPALEKALAYLFDQCQGDPACSATYPELESEWAAVLERFSQGPVEAAVTHPETGSEETIILSRGVFVDGIRRMLYRVQAWSRVAEVIHLAAEGDFNAFVAQRFFVRGATMRDLSLGMLLTIACTETVPLLSDETIERVTVGTSLGDYRVRTIRNACREWGQGSLPPDWSEPVRSPVPVLILSGAVDPATPPWVAVEVAEYLPNSVHVIIPNRSHAPTDMNCESGVIREFLAEGSGEGLDIECLQNTAWPEFKPSAPKVDAVDVDTELLARYVGSYELQPGFVLVVTLEKGQLFIKPPGESRHALQPVSDDTFFVAEIGERITFLPGDDGIIDRFKLENGPTAKKVD